MLQWTRKHMRTHVLLKPNIVFRWVDHHICPAAIFWRWSFSPLSSRKRRVTSWTVQRSRDPETNNHLESGRHVFLLWEDAGVSGENLQRRANRRFKERITTPNASVLMPGGGMICPNLNLIYTYILWNRKTTFILLTKRTYYINVLLRFTASWSLLGVASSEEQPRVVFDRTSNNKVWDHIEGLYSPGLPPVWSPVSPFVSSLCPF